MTYDLLPLESWKEVFKAQGYSNVQDPGGLSKVSTTSSTYMTNLWDSRLTFSWQRAL